MSTDPRDQLVKDADILAWAEDQIGKLAEWDPDTLSQDDRDEFHDLCERYRFAAAHGQQAAMDGEQPVENARRQYLLDHAPGIAGHLAAAPSEMAAREAIQLAGLIFDEINPPEGSGS